jgi:uncharacterized protein (TIGR03435 family)
MKSLCALLLAFASFSLSAQSFEVATVRLCPDNDTRMSVFHDPTSENGRLTLQRISLEVLLEVAYGVDGYQLEEPKSARETCYDVSAVTEGDKPVSRDQYRSMMQKLLEERLHLAVHRETKMLDGYALIAAKGGPKLPPPTQSATGPSIFPNAILAHRNSVEMLAHLLILPLGRPVVDKTGISGDFDISLKYAQLTDTDSDQPSIFVAIKEQLGLQLDPQKVPVEMIVVDKIDKVPTEN